MKAQLAVTDDGIVGGGFKQFLVQALALLIDTLVVVVGVRELDWIRVVAGRELGARVSSLGEVHDRGVVVGLAVERVCELLLLLDLRAAVRDVVRVR